jgi:integrase
MFNLACGEWEWLDKNPVWSVSLEGGVAKRDRWITAEEEDQILARCPDWLKEVVIFALNTGMREGEIVDLSWKGGVDLSRKTITVLRSKNEEKRTIPMNATVFEMMREKGKVRQLLSGQVFHLDCKPLTVYHIQRFFKLACNEAGIKDLHFHDLRHTFATRLVQAGEDLYKVQVLLGHKGAAMTQRYAHHYPESLRGSVEILDQLKAVTNLSQMVEGNISST